MASGQIDEIDLVTPETAGVNQKKEMQPDDKRGDQNGRDPTRLAQKCFLRRGSHNLIKVFSQKMKVPAGKAGWFCADRFPRRCREPRHSGRWHSCPRHLLFPLAKLRRTRRQVCNWFDKNSTNRIFRGPSRDSATRT